MTAVVPRADRPEAITTLRLGTRRSALAIAQSRTVAAGIETASVRAGHPVRVELVEVTTTGDVSQGSLSSFDGVGVFVSTLREALVDGRVDLAVHSLKDLPTAPYPGLALAAVPVREAVHDVLVTHGGGGLAELPDGALVGTGSPRRAAQLRGLLPGVKIVDIRGNVDTRLRMVHDGELDAVVLALAGLRRLGREAEVSEVLAPTVMLPAPGQGALGVECRADDATVQSALAPLDHAPTHRAVLAERALLARLDAGCAAPLGALAEVVPATGTAAAAGTAGLTDLLTLQAVVIDPEASVVFRRVVTGPVGAPEELGHRLAAALLADGAGRLVATASSPRIRYPAVHACSSQTDHGSVVHHWPDQYPAGEGDL